MEFLDYLKFGAIGISLALAILSYRLLSKEQEKPEVRKPILNTIRLYFLLTLLLSFFFGASEIVRIIVNQSESEQNYAIDKIWNKHFHGFPDSTLAQKSDRISDHILTDTSALCSDFITALEKCRQEMADFDAGFYQNIIRLQNALRADPDNWINLAYRIEGKQDVIEALKGIFTSLGENCDGLTNEEIVGKWKNFKAGWTNQQLQYVFQSDLAVLVRLFLDKYSK